MMHTSLHQSVPHHSTVDWDFNNANWQLDNTHFVSAPTALNGKAPYCGRILCRVAGALVLPQGRMVTSRYCTWVPETVIVFRHQGLLGDASFQDCYEVQFLDGQWVNLRTRISGVRSQIDTWPIKPTNDIWQRWRVTWWNGVDLMNNPAIGVELHQYLAGDWTSYGVLYDPNNRWENSTTNRCGLGYLFASAWIDDTEIWVPL